MKYIEDKPKKWEWYEKYAKIDTRALMRKRLVRRIKNKSRFWTKQWIIENRRWLGDKEIQLNNADDLAEVTEHYRSWCYNELNLKLKYWHAEEIKLLEKIRGKK